MELKTARKRKVKAWRRLRKPAGVLKLPRPAKKRRIKTLSSCERFLKALEKVMREDDEAMRILART